MLVRLNPVEKFRVRNSSRIVLRKHVSDGSLEDIRVSSIEFELVQLLVNVVMIEFVVLEIIEWLKIF